MRPAALCEPTCGMHPRTLRAVDTIRCVQVQQLLNTLVLDTEIAEMELKVRDVPVCVQ